MLLLTLTVVLFSAIILHLRKVYTKLSSQGINHLPIVPILGNMGLTFLQRQHSTITFEKTYSTFPNDRILGLYELMSPVYIAKDLELVKNITVKDFEYFVDRVGFSEEFQDPLFAKSLLFLKGEEWKAMRATLSPAFTSSKIRLMVPFMVEVGNLTMNNLKIKIKESAVDYIDVDVRDVMSRYANDVIATCAFGLKVNSLEHDTALYTKSKEATELTIRHLYKVFILKTFPRIAGMLKVSLISTSYCNFFRNIVLKAMKMREEQNLIRNDIIDLLIQAKKDNFTYDRKETQEDNSGNINAKKSTTDKKTNHYEWTDVHLVAQAFLFLLAGFETISTVLSFLFYELALHPDIQNKLYQEIRKNNDENNGKFEYTSLEKMSYLDMVVSETLRKWPPATIVNRLCIKDYNLGRPNDKTNKHIILRKGQAIQIPIWPIQRDPNFYPDPEKFDPERFSDANKDKIKPFTYMPFGLGPRNCIGSRFALCDIKVIVYQLLLNIELLPCEKTCVSGRLASDSLQLRLSGGYWMRMKIRHSFNK